jgi:hypothetical protein
VQDTKPVLKSPKFRIESLLRKAKAVGGLSRSDMDTRLPQADRDPGERPIPVDRDVDSSWWECTGQLVRAHRAPSASHLHVMCI